MSGCDEATLLLPALHAVLQSVTWLTTSRLAPMTLHLSEARKQPGRSSMLPSRPRRISNSHSSYAIMRWLLGCVLTQCQATHISPMLSKGCCPPGCSETAAPTSGLQLRLQLGVVPCNALAGVCCSVVWAPACPPDT